MTSSSVVAVLAQKERTQRLSDKVAELIGEAPALFPELMFGLWHVEAYVRERADDAMQRHAEKEPVIPEAIESISWLFPGGGESARR